MDFAYTVIGKKSAADPSDPELSARRHGKPGGSRDSFNRDAQRILHSARFRKLQDKMEIGLPGFGGEGRRTALTLAMEVVSMAMSDCRMYGLNHDLALAISLAQSLGAPPYGRTGAKFISEVMGQPFNRYEYALYIMTKVQAAYPHPGLNPTRAVRDALVHMALKESGKLSLPMDDDLDPQSPLVTLEGALVEGYVKIVQAAGYFEDFVNSRTITLDQLAEILETQRVFSDLYGTFPDDVQRLKNAARDGRFEAGLVPNVTKAILNKGARRLEDALKSQSQRGTKPIDRDTFEFPRVVISEAEELVREIEFHIEGARGYHEWSRDVKQTICRLNDITRGNLGDAPTEKVVCSILDSPESFEQRINYRYQNVLEALVNQLSLVAEGKVQSPQHFEAQTLPRILDVFDTPALSLIDVIEEEERVVKVRTLSREGYKLGHDLSREMREELEQSLFRSGRQRYSSRECPWWSAVFGERLYEPSPVYARKLGKPLMRPRESTSLIILCEIPPTLYGNTSAIELELEGSFVRHLMNLYFVGLSEFADSVQATRAHADGMRVDDEAVHQMLRSLLHDIKSPAGNAKRHVDAICRVAGKLESELGADHALARKLRRSCEALQASSARVSEEISKAAEKSDTWLLQRPVELKPFLLRLASRFEGTELDVVLDAPESLFALLNEHRLGQVIGDILDNARKHAYKGHAGKAWVRARSEGADVLIECWNHGQSLTRDTAEGLFSRYKAGGERGDWKWGLSQARRSVESMGGKIECYPVNLETGATRERFDPVESGPAYFRIVFKNARLEPDQACEQLARQSALTRTAADLESAQRSGRVLVVDDSPEHQLRLAKSISDLGFEVTTESTFEEAKCAIEGGDFYACVLDVDLGSQSGDGLDLLSIFREKFPRRRAIVTSSDATSQWKSKAIRLGAIEAIDKDALDHDVFRASLVPVVEPRELANV